MMLYDIIGELPVSDSAEDGFTGAILGYMNSTNLEALRKSIIVPNVDGGMGLYFNVLNF